MLHVTPLPPAVSKKLASVASLVALCYVGQAVLLALVSFLYEQFGPDYFSDPSGSQVPFAQRLMQLPLYQALALAAVLGPLAEELALRSWLRQNRLAYGGLLSLVVLLGMGMLKLPGVLAYTTTIGIFIAFGLLLRLLGQKTDLDAGKRQPYLLIAVSIYVFGIAHAMRYGGLTLHALLHSYEYLSFMLAGAMFSYVRLRYGFYYGWFAHSLNKLVPLAAMLLGKWGAGLAHFLTIANL